MSSKLHRGGIPVDPMAWPRTGPADPRLAASPVPMYAPAGTTAPSHASTDPEGAGYQRGLEDGQASARREAAESIDHLVSPEEAIRIALARQ